MAAANNAQTHHWFHHGVVAPLVSGSEVVGSAVRFFLSPLSWLTLPLGAGGGGVAGITAVGGGVGGTVGAGAGAGVKSLAAGDGGGVGLKSKAGITGEGEGAGPQLKSGVVGYGVVGGAVKI
jgi:hypothetical protein